MNPKDILDTGKWGVTISSDGKFTMTPTWGDGHTFNLDIDQWNDLVEMHEKAKEKPFPAVTQEQAEAAKKAMAELKKEQDRLAAEEAKARLELQKKIEEEAQKIFEDKVADKALELLGEP